MAQFYFRFDLFITTCRKTTPTRKKNFVFFKTVRNILCLLALEPAILGLICLIILKVSGTVQLIFAVSEMSFVFLHMWLSIDLISKTANLKPNLVVVSTIENGDELCIWVCFSFFFFIFLAKTDTTNNHWTGLTDISY